VGQARGTGLTDVASHIPHPCSHPFEAARGTFVLPLYLGPNEVERSAQSIESVGGPVSLALETCQGALTEVLGPREKSIRALLTELGGKVWKLVDRDVEAVFPRR